MVTIHPSVICFSSMGGQRLKLSSVKRYKKKRKARLADKNSKTGFTLSRDATVTTEGISLSCKAVAATVCSGTVATDVTTSSTVAATDGTVSATSSTVAATDGHVSATNRTVAVPNGTVVATNGTVVATNGTVATTNRAVAVTDGTVAPTGDTVATNGDISGNAGGTSCIPITTDVNSHNSVSLDMTNLTVSLPLLYKQCQVQNLVQLKNFFAQMEEFTNWQIIEATVERFSLVKMKLTPSPQVTASLQIYPNFEYNISMGDHRINLGNLGMPVCTHVYCVNDLRLIFNAINSLHLCEGNLCEEFSEVVFAQ